ncbi:probable 39S ribosomal protein L24, mitochondrial [Coccinella septempunctata]|uniref:probable 39S ribosomal protein L24, mitochondrial n=1 Tax=Coccinella septempunctata TaxID=41139 RepID=UPI001D08535D|nr:probable 39S ribosomal protein L24, mitochondrial [Coccinella septempunctata]
MRLSSVLSKAKNWSNQYSNLPESYIKRATEQVYWKNPKGPQYKPNTEIKRKKFNYTVDRSWSLQFQQENAAGKCHPKVWVEPLKEWSYFRGDRVEVLEGKDKGKQGFVSTIIQERNWVLVEGLNCKLEKMGTKENTVYYQKEQPLLVTTQVVLVDPSDLKPTSFEWRYTEEGEKVRVSTRTGRIIPIPATNEETRDYKSKSTYKEQPKDTLSAEVDKITFEPKLCTFEMEIMEKMGIKEDRVPAKSYWY